MPRVSIGVPVYNGAALIGGCLANLAEQSFTDFEVIISDNASSDETSDICEAFSSRDRRFRVIRRDVTSTAMQNFLAVRREALSPLFMWRAFDDLSSANFIEALVALHDEKPDIALAAPAVLQRFGPRKPERNLPYVDASDSTRMAVLLSRIRQMQAGWFYGLWRLDAAERATEDVYRHFPDDWAADYLALFHAVLHGGIVGTNACTFHQQVLAEVRGYMPRSKPSFDQMTDRNGRFAETCRVMIAEANLTKIEAVILRAYLPLFTNRCSHRAKRVLQAGVRKLWGC